MLDFQQKRKAKSYMYNRVTIGVLFFAVFFALHSTWSVYQKQKESEELKSISEKKVQELEIRNMEINAKIQALDTQEGLEREIRGKFNVIKEQENMVVIIEDNSKATSVSTTTMQFWKKIIKLFKR